MTTNRYYPGVGALSPDAKYFAVSSRDPGRSTALRLVPTGGGEPRELLRVNAPQSLLVMTWTPDSQGLIVLRTSAAADAREVWLVSAKDGKYRKIDIDTRGLESIRVHPDGRQIAYVAGRQESEV